MNANDDEAGCMNNLIATLNQYSIVWAIREYCCLVILIWVDSVTRGGMPINLLSNAWSELKNITPSTSYILVLYSTRGQGNSEYWSAVIYYRRLIIHACKANSKQNALNMLLWLKPVKRWRFSVVKNTFFDWDSLDYNISIFSYIPEI